MESEEVASGEGLADLKTLRLKFEQWEEGQLSEDKGKSNFSRKKSSCKGPGMGTDTSGVRDRKLAGIAGG